MNEQITQAEKKVNSSEICNDLAKIVCLEDFLVSSNSKIWPKVRTIYMLQLRSNPSSLTQNLTKMNGPETFLWLQVSFGLNQERTDNRGFYMSFDQMFDKSISN